MKCIKFFIGTLLFCFFFACDAPNNDQNETSFESTELPKEDEVQEKKRAYGPLIVEQPYIEGITAGRWYQFIRAIEKAECDSAFELMALDMNRNNPQMPGIYQFYCYKKGEVRTEQKQAYFNNRAFKNDKTGDRVYRMEKSQGDFLFEMASNEKSVFIVNNAGERIAEEEAFERIYNHSVSVVWEAVGVLKREEDTLYAFHNCAHSEAIYRIKPNEKTDKIWAYVDRVMPGSDEVALRAEIMYMYDGRDKVQAQIVELMYVDQGRECP